MVPRMRHDAGGSQPLTTARRRQQGPRRAASCAPSHVQRPSSPPTATMACTQGLGTPLPDTLAHSYAPRCTPGLSPCLYKRGVQGHLEGGSREGSGVRALSLSLTRRACNPYCERHPWCRIIQGLSHILCFIPRQPIWAGARSDNLLVGPGTPRGRNADNMKTMSMLINKSCEKDISNS
jgi:hypothetical protein